jgi:hypothetical protein
VVLTSEQASDLKIVEPPSWDLFKRYIPHRDFSNWTIIPGSNIGAVQIQPGGFRVEHVLYVRETGTSWRAAPASVSAFLKPPRKPA